MANWDFGGAYLGSTGEAQKQDIAQARAPFDLAHLSSLSRLQNAQASEAEMRAKAEGDMATLMQSVNLAGPGTASDKVLTLAGTAAKAGAANIAKDFLLRASQLKTQETAQASHDATAARQAQLTHIKTAELFNSLHTGAESQQDWDAANLLFTSQTGEAVPDELRSFTPELGKALSEGSLKLADRMRLQISREDFESKKKEREDRIRHRRAVENATTARDAARAKAAADKAKLGGKDVGAPSQQEVGLATDAIANDPTIKLDDDAGRIEAANDVAARARALRKANPGLDQSEALQRALVELKTAGAFVQVPKYSGRTVTKYSKQGLSAATPLLLTGKPDPKDLLRGKFYKGPGGVFQWDGTKPVRVAPTAPASDDEDEE